jgi:hypothetical protein
MFLQKRQDQPIPLNDRWTWREDLPFLQWTEEEWAIILDKEIEREPSAEELRLLDPGYHHRVLAGVLARMAKGER